MTADEEGPTSVSLENMIGAAVDTQREIDREVEQFGGRGWGALKRYRGHLRALWPRDKDGEMVETAKVSRKRQGALSQEAFAQLSRRDRRALGSRGYGFGLGASAPSLKTRRRS